MSWQYLRNIPAPITGCQWQVQLSREGSVSGPYAKGQATGLSLCISREEFAFESDNLFILCLKLSPPQILGALVLDLSAEHECSLGISGNLGTYRKLSPANKKSLSWSCLCNSSSSKSIALRMERLGSTMRVNLVVQLASSRVGL